MITDQWDSLNNAARANLTEHQFNEFLKYKEELRKDGEDWKEAELILTGFIWDASETLDFED